MEENSPSLEVENPDSKTDGPQDDVVQQKNACAETRPECEPKTSESDVPTKKRKTRRGKSKRKTPYQKYGRMVRKNGKIILPVLPAPHNDNKFIIEDHGGLEELDERLKCVDQASNSTVTRTRDSSFSVDSDCEFYSSPDDEDDFLMKDFNDQYQSIQTEQLHTMSKQELIDQYISLENRYQQLSSLEDTIKKLERELDKQKTEKENLQRENETLKSKLENVRNGHTDSEDSETDSSDSCSSSSSSTSCSSSRSVSPVFEEPIDYTQTNGHTSPLSSIEPV